MNDQATSEVFAEYAIENANLRITVKVLQLQIEELKKQIEEKEVD